MSDFAGESLSVDMAAIDQRWMSLANAAAREALHAGEVPVGCVFVKDGVVIASGRYHDMYKL